MKKTHFEAFEDRFGVKASDKTEVKGRKVQSLMIEEEEEENCEKKREIYGGRRYPPAHIRLLFPSQLFLHGLFPRSQHFNPLPPSSRGFVLLVAVSAFPAVSEIDTGLVRLHFQLRIFLFFSTLPRPIEVDTHRSRSPKVNFSRGSQLPIWCLDRKASNVVPGICRETKVENKQSWSGSMLIVP